MKKFNFLIGALGGALGGYLLSNPELRKKLAAAKDHNEAAKILGRELQKSGKKVAKEAKALVERDDVNEKFNEWKQYFIYEGDKLKQKATSKAKSTAKKAKKKVKATCKKVCKKAKAKMKR